MTKMTRVHFRAFAEALKHERPTDWSLGEHDDKTALWQWRRDVRAIADVLARSNGQFDRDTFFRAAGMEE